MRTHTATSLKLALVIFSAVIAGCSHKQPTTKDVLNGLLNKYKSHNSISFHSYISVKPIRADVYKYSIKAKLIRNDKDTLFNGYVWVASRWGNYDYPRYYNLDKIYNINDSLKTITVYNDPKTQYWAILGNTAYNKAVNVGFLDLSGLEAAVKDSLAHDSLNNDKIDGEDCYRIFVRLKDDDAFTDRYKILWLRAKDTMLVQMKTHGLMQGQESYTEWKFDNIKFDSDKPENLETDLKNKLSAYKIDEYTPPDPEKEKPLANGLKAPSFEGTIYSTGKHTSLEDFKGKLVLIDFWYITCGWCIKAMPDIEKIEDKFKNQGLVVLGINSFDIKESDKNRLDECIKTNKMNYDVLLTKHRTDSLYNIHGYPTLYFIDKKGMIAYSHEGYEKNLDSILEAEVKKLIKK